MRRSTVSIFLSLWVGLGALVGQDWPEIAFPPELESLNNALESHISESGRGVALKEGERLPEFGLINQQGEVVRISDMQGKPFVLNFIFTRCQAAKMCPASSSRMAKLQREAPAAGLPELRFATISFDPIYDTPSVLRSYAKNFGITDHNFHFLTHPSQSFIDSLLFLFGILTRAENGTIEHTTTTYLIDGEGRVLLKQNGPDWSAEKIIEAALGK